MMGGPGGGYGPSYGRGYGWGPRGGYPLDALGLSDEQSEKVAKIQEDARRKNWDLMGQMRSEQFKLRNMYYADKVDPNAVVEQQKKIDELRQKLVKSQVETRNQIAALLTPEQQKQFRSFGPCCYGGDDY